MYTFICEKCGKSCQTKSDPTTWKRQLCFDCRRAETNSTKPTKTAAQYTPPASKFDLMTYISEMVVVYNAIKTVCAEENIEIPEANIAQWTTSIMIQKDKYRGM